MKHSKLCTLTVCLLLAMTLSVAAQKSKPQRAAKKPPVEKKAPPAKSQNEEKVRDLVAFLQLLLNTLGSNETSARDKEIVITESYAKIFRDGKVQVEDDLAENRSVITNKDVVAYLKDVDFFFDNIAFEFTIESIEEGTNANGQVFYKVSARRTITGKTSTGGKVINNTIPRFIEVNYDPEAEDLKIVSIYTNEFDEKEALTNWWRTLSFEWQTIFKSKVNVTDSVGLDDIKDMTALSELDLSGNQYIQSIEPLSQLIGLRLLNLSGTNVSDLTPIRNLTELVELDLSRTKIFDLSPLKYSARLARLNINDTEIRSIAVVEKMSGMQNLEMQRTQVFDFEPLAYLTSLVNLDLQGTQLASLAPVGKMDALQELNISRTLVQDLSPLSAATSLQSLNIDSTLVRDVTPLATLENLEVLYANYTFVSDLSPLQKLPRLERVYCDQTPVKKPAADAFMSSKPGVLVIYDSRDLQSWWDSLPDPWRTVLAKTAGISATPGKEELARVPNVDSINVSNDRSLTTLEPLRKLQKLRVVRLNNTGITDLGPLEEHREIREMDISDTEVQELSPLARFTKLEVLRADRSKIQTLEPLFGLRQLRQLFVDRTTIHDITAQEFLEKIPSCLIVYKTIHLDRWWNNLPDEWKGVFQQQMGTDTSSSRENLHELVEQEKLHFMDARVRDLSVLGEFIRLKELHFSGTGITQIPALESLRALRSLHANRSPLQEIGAVSQLKSLEDLDISDTPIEDLRPLEGLENLRSLNCAGTQVRNLDPLQGLHQLEFLDCSNTGVRKLDPVMYLSIRELRAYNTKISSREMEQFKENNPGASVVYYR